MYRELEVLASAARTVSGDVTFDTLGGNTDGLSAGDARLYLDVSVASGGDAILDLVVKGVVNGIEFQLDTFTQVVAAGKQVKLIQGCPKTVKIEWTIAGTTPSFTFSMAATRH